MTTRAAAPPWPGSITAMGAKQKIRSMTGFGRAEAAGPVGRITVEIKSVNSRHSEINFTLSRDLGPLEHPLRGFFRDRIERGKVDCKVRYEPAPGRSIRVRINGEIVIQYMEQLRDLHGRCSAPGEVTLGMAMQMPGAVEQIEDAAALEETWAVLTEAAGKALDAFEAERLREGGVLAEQLLAELTVLRQRREHIAARKDLILDKYRERLASRVAELEEQIRAKVDPGRMEIEIAMFVDRSDISEELVRLGAHLDQFEALVTGGSGKSPGRALNFLLQEILREVNTIASKSHGLEISQAALDMKTAIERAREQIQNIE